MTQERGLCPKKVDDMQRCSGLFDTFFGGGEALPCKCNSCHEGCTTISLGNSLESTRVGRCQGQVCFVPARPLPVDPEAPMGGLRRPS